MDFWIFLLLGIGMAWFGAFLWESDIRIRLWGVIPLPKFLIAGLLVLMGVGAVITGFEMIPDDFLGGSLSKLVSVFDFGSDEKKQREADAAEQYAYAENAPSYISGYWGEKFVRSNGYTYPFVFDNPIPQCVGFTLEYEISDVQGGDLNGNFRYEVYVRQMNGKWKSVDLFQMDGYRITRDISFDMMDIDAVAVVCQKKGNFTFSYSIAVCDARYT